MPIRVGLIGCGNIAVGRHVPAYLAMPELVEIVAVADPTPERRDAAAALLGLGPDDVHADPLELIGRADVTAVDVSTPPHVRTPIALAALRAGKPVLCEKPIATIPREAAELVAEASTSGVALGVVHNYLYFPEIVAARRIIESGEIGEPEVAILNFLGVDDRPGTEGYRPGWRHETRVAGGGVLMDMMHAMYVAEALLGRPIVRVSAHIDARESDATVESLALCRVETDGGTGLVNVGWGVGPGGLAVSGTAGRLDIRYENGDTSPFAPLESISVVDRDGARRQEPVFVDPAEGSPAVFVTAALRDFFTRLAEGRPPRATGLDGAHVLQAVIAAYGSAATGRTVPLPLSDDAPTFLRGVAGVAELDGPSWSPIIRRGLFGTPTNH
ncbi:MAG: Gfo/Idh/MocA family oxidoreductase [Chloroflexi bacterium]|nr:Gfo/Idh/MocA family oxidoreductase [Chloroflexota bacterium]